VLEPRGSRCWILDAGQIDESGCISVRLVFAGLLRDA
jgi:hypothetical protein